MAFPEISDRDRALLRSVDAGVAVREVAATAGLTRARVYQILRSYGRGSGRSLPVITAAQRAAVLGDFAQHAGITRAARVGAMAPSTARAIVLSAGGPSAAAVRGRRRTDATGGVPDALPRSRHKRPMMISRSAVPAPISERYLSLADRLAIADGLQAGRSGTEIALGIGKDKSTVSREISGRSIQGIYLPYQAHQAAATARARPKTSKLVTDPALRAEVEQGLQRKMSPEQISHRLIKDFPANESMRVSHETIYQALYFQARGGLKREVAQALRTGRTRRKPHRAPDARQHRFIDAMVMIADRPAEVEDRAIPGHWEGDLIMGTDNKTAIATLVERTTRYTMLVHLPDGHHAEHVRDQLIATVATLPGHLRGSLTWDQGCEMARHAQFALATDMAVYFCDPASPWQRGTNENTNGLLRQYFPKGTDLSVHGPADLEHVAQELNARPRKTLGWETPAERLRDLLTT